MEDGITRAVTRSNGTGMEDGITRAVTRERRKRRSRGEVVRGIISIRGLGPCFYLSPFGMCLRGVSLWLTGGDPDPERYELYSDLGQVTPAVQTDALVAVSELCALS